MWLQISATLSFCLARCGYQLALYCHLFIEMCGFKLALHRLFVYRSVDASLRCTVTFKPRCGCKLTLYYHLFTEMRLQISATLAYCLPRCGCKLAPHCHIVYRSGCKFALHYHFSPDFPYYESACMHDLQLACSCLYEWLHMCPSVCTVVWSDTTLRVYHKKHVVGCPELFADYCILTTIERQFKMS
jgi:hypothetical protein